MSSLVSTSYSRVALYSAILAAAFCLALPAQGQTFSVIHNFTGGADGANPYAGLTLDRAGNLYGTTMAGGYTGSGCNSGCGTAFKLSQKNGHWMFDPLHIFSGPGNNDGAYPLARIVFGPDGALYGTTSSGGSRANGGQAAGTVFRMTPPRSVCRAVVCPWIETVLYPFAGPPDGSAPGYGDVAFDAAGNIYGTTINGGSDNYLCNDGTCGTVYELAHSGGGWAESLLYQFIQGSIPGYWPYPGVIFDSAGNLYGATTWNFGTVFELTPGSDGGWTPNTLYVFENYSQDGGAPAGGLIFDQAGNLYGTTSGDGPNNGGTVFELVHSGGQWNLNTLYAFTYTGNPGFNPPGPTSTLVMDANGNLYGTTLLDGAFNQGSVFKLTHAGGSWVLTTLHDFTGGSDGANPWGQLVLDANGDIYGTATAGGSTVGSCSGGLGCGVVFEITP